MWISYLYLLIGLLSAEQMIWGRSGQRIKIRNMLLKITFIQKSLMYFDQLTIMISGQRKVPSNFYLQHFQSVKSKSNKISEETVLVSLQVTLKNTRLWLSRIKNKLFACSVFLLSFLIITVCVWMCVCTCVCVHVHTQASYQEAPKFSGRKFQEVLIFFHNFTPKWNV